MKRAVIVAVFAAVVASAWTFLAAQSSPVPNVPVPTVAPLPAKAPASPFVAQPNVSLFGSEAAVAQPKTEPVFPPLQQRFIELSTQKARLLSPEQLQKAVTHLDQELVELNAWSKVEESARVLRDVAEKSPNTAAGRAAKAALRMIDQSRSADGPVPDPDKGTVERPYEREKLSPESEPKVTPGPNLPTNRDNLLNQLPFEPPSPPPKV